MTVGTPTSKDFPVGDTLAGGAYRVTEHVAGFGSAKFGMATRASDPGAPCTVSTIWRPKDMPEDVVVGLSYELDGVHQLVHIGRFDRAGDDRERNIQQEQHLAMVEQPRGGTWLPRAIVAGAADPAMAVSLGLSVGRILEDAARAGVVLVGVRPEYIWVDRQGNGWRAVSVSGRNFDFFAQVGGRCMLPSWIFERPYYAPEVGTQPLGDRSLVFTLATMIAEWASGSYPYPDVYVGGSDYPMTMGRHAPLHMPIHLAGLVAQGLQGVPARRPSLADFLSRLSRLVSS